MNVSIGKRRGPYRGTGAGIAAAVVVAVTIAAVVVTEPHTHDLAIPPRPLAIEVQSRAVALTSVEQFTTAITSPNHTADATPQANASGPTVNNLGRAALLIGLAQVWYTAFPITLPATIAVVYFAEVAISCIRACGVGVDARVTLQFGSWAWANAPKDLIRDAVKNLVPQPKSTSAAQSRTMLNSSRAPMPTRRHDNNAPSTQRTIKETSSQTSKKSTAASGRVGSKKP